MQTKRSCIWIGKGGTTFSYHGLELPSVQDTWAILRLQKKPHWSCIWWCWRLICYVCIDIPCSTLWCKSTSLKC